MNIFKKLFKRKQPKITKSGWLDLRCFHWTKVYLFKRKQPIVCPSDWDNPNNQPIAYSSSYPQEKFKLSGCTKEARKLIKEKPFINLALIGDTSVCGNRSTIKKTIDFVKKHANQIIFIGDYAEKPFKKGKTK